MHPFVNIAVKAARHAGRAIMRYQEKLDTLSIGEKSPLDLVTAADLRAEEIIIETLHTAYPDHDIIAEESGHHERKAEYTWLIDPIDGTFNFSHGFPYFCISIACLHKGKVEHAVIFNPNNDDLFTATRGNGAKKNDQRIRISSRIKLEGALIASGLAASARDKRELFEAVQSSLSESSCILRHSGAAALDLAYTASGQLDGFWEMGLKPWDIAAGALLVKEAGGIVSEFNGGEHYLQSGKILAANPKLIKPLAQKVNRIIV
ncbi:MAG: inositol monophosphatase [Gammaproteobacteria bacterium CG11_big_fil_rev_8_21_14_0_20_46_22]|nr:MAG: inositol monophosphatase [Gammaproteobacteria bacterium CG12_big_fil_rev_8_21_14_0_65_46_12]PIR11675.1 MAG: inositol monophosphatase [Gammaproteobacteria bacterium CG11_big_fil_rev_8_21_14_0_20_46_22]